MKGYQDLVRLAASSIAMGQSTFILRFIKNDKPVYGVLAVFRDFYKMYGVPLLYYYVDNEGKIPRDANYALLKSSNAGETIEFSKGSKAGYITIPIINLAETPEFIEF